MRQKLLAIIPDIEFYLKIAIACTLIQQIIARILGAHPLGLVHQSILLWLTGSLSFYGLGFGIETLIKRNPPLRKKTHSTEGGGQRTGLSLLHGSRTRHGRTQSPRHRSGHSLSSPRGAEGQ